MDAGDTRELAGHLRDAIELIHGPTEVDRPHHQEQEDRDRDRELDQALTTLAGPAARPPTRAHHGVTETFRDFVAVPPLFEITSVTVNEPCDWYW